MNPSRFIIEQECTDNEDFITTLHFSFAPHFKEEQLPTLHFEPVRNEVVIDGYFEIPPICLVEDGEWPKTRLIFSDLYTSKEDFIFKRVIPRELKDNEDSTVWFKVRHYNSGTELVDAILEEKKTLQNSSVCQQFFCTTHILRYVFQHKTDQQVQLHLCSLRMGPFQYYNFGLIKVGRKCSVEEIEYFLNQLNPFFKECIHPANCPTIRKMQSEKSPLLQFNPYSRLYQDISFAESPLIFQDAKFKEVLLETLEEVSEY